MIIQNPRPPIPDRPMTGDPDRGALPYVGSPVSIAVVLFAIVVVIAIVVAVVG